MKFLITERKVKKIEEKGKKKLGLSKICPYTTLDGSCPFLVVFSHSSHVIRYRYEVWIWLWCIYLLSFINKIMNMWVRYIYRAHLPHWTFSPTCDTAYCNTPNNHLQQKYCTPFYFWCICDLNFNTWEAWQKESCSCLHKGFSNLRKDIWLLQTTGIHFKWIFFKVWYKAHLIICFCLRGEINAPKYRKQIQRNEQIQKQRKTFSECGEFAEIKLWESSRLLWWMRVGKVVKRGGSEIK